MKSVMKSVLLVIFFVVSFQLSAAPVDINTADAKALAANMKGIGAKKAEAIVKYREKHGPFKRVEDLTKIKGIGLKTIEKNRGILLVKSGKKRE